MIKHKAKKEMTLGKHAELWHKKKGHKVPKRGTRAWNNMYQKWIEYAFKNLR